MENEMLVDTNVNLKNKIRLIEKESKTRCVGLVMLLRSDWMVVIIKFVKFF